MNVPMAPGSSVWGPQVEPAPNVEPGDGIAPDWPSVEYAPPGLDITIPFVAPCDEEFSLFAFFLLRWSIILSLAASFTFLFICCFSIFLAEYSISCMQSGSTSSEDFAFFLVVEDPAGPLRFVAHMFSRTLL